MNQAAQSGPVLSVGDDNAPLVAEDYAGDIIEDAAADGITNVDNSIDIVAKEPDAVQGTVQAVNQVQADEEDDDDDEESDELDDVLDDGKFSRLI